MSGIQNDVKFLCSRSVHEDIAKRGREEGAKAERERYNKALDIIAKQISMCPHPSGFFCGQNIRSLRNGQKQIDDEEYAAKVHHAQYLDYAVKGQEREPEWASRKR